MWPARSVSRTVRRMASWHAAVMLRVGSLPTPLHSCQGPHDPAPAPYAPHPSSMRPSGMRPSPLRHVLPAPPLAWLAANPPPLSPALACSANKVGRDAPRAQCGPRPHPREYECRDLAVGHVGPLHPYPDCGAGRGGGGIIIRSIRIYYILSSSFIIITVLFRYYYYCYP